MFANSAERPAQRWPRGAAVLRFALFLLFAVLTRQSSSQIKDLPTGTKKTTWMELPSPWETLGGDPEYAVQPASVVLSRTNDGVYPSGGQSIVPAPPRSALWEQTGPAVSSTFVPPANAPHWVNRQPPQLHGFIGEDALIETRMETTMETAMEIAVPRLSRNKKGFFQTLALRHTWIGGTNEGNFGLHQSQAIVSVAVPAPRRDWPLVLSAGFSNYSLDGPVGLNVPSQLFDASLSFIWLPRFSERWKAIFAVMPGVYSDYEGTASDSLRIKGIGIMRFAWSKQLELLAGVVYLDRADIRVVPAAGFVWSPTPDLLLEISLPRPKLAHRMVASPQREIWRYVAAELGGETWTIQRGAGTRQMTLREYRLLAGVEFLREGGGGYQLEGGFVFDRRLRFSDPRQVVRGQDAWVLRAGVSW